MRIMFKTASSLWSASSGIFAFSSLWKPGKAIGIVRPKSYFEVTRERRGSALDGDARP